MSFLNKNFWLCFIQLYLIAIYPAIRVATSSFGLVYLGEVFILLSLLFVLTLLIYSLFGFIYKDWKKSSLFVSVALIVFYGFHFFSNAYLVPIARFTEQYFYKFRVRYFLVLAILLLIFIFYIILRTKKIPTFLTRFLIIPLIAIYIYFFLAVLPLASTLNHEKCKWDEQREKILNKHLSEFAIPKNRQDLPDVYYIILDMYTSEKILKQDHDWDISWFIKKLKDKGFYVAQNSFSNYGNTALSISSFLNMNYHDHMDLNVIFGFGLYKMKSNVAVKFFENLGYNYIHAGASSLFTCVPFNSKKYAPSFKNSFKNSIYRLLRPFGYLSVVFGCWSILNYYWLDSEFYRHYLAGLKSFSDLESSINEKGPKFVFAHVMCPHGPYVFDKDGNYCGVGKADEEYAYAHQVEFASKKIDKILDKILSKPGKKPIIILKGDHGVSHVDMILSEKAGVCLVDLPKRAHEMFPILNAFYFPDKQGNEIIYDSISPVNEFRLIFNKYFGTNFERLKDSSFFGPDTSGKFTCIDSFKN